MDDSDSHPVNQRLSSARQTFWPVIESKLPLDVSLHHAELLQNRLTEDPARRFPSDRTINVEFLIVPRSNICQRNIVPLRILCTSAAEVTDALGTIDPVASCSMILAHSDPVSKKPCITASLLSSNM